MTLQEANNYIQEHKNKVVEQYRLVYHALPELGWMNDPNGMIFYQGKYHLFYQYHPYDSVWGPMHWGHLISSDLVSFTHLPVALAPDLSDEDGCFSGNAIVDPLDQNQLYLIYTKHVYVNGVVEERQGIAQTTDGIHFTKRTIPIIGLDLVAPHGATTDNRDPFPFYRNGKYYVILGSKDETDQGKFLVFSSKDLSKFSYHTSFSHPSLAHSMAECPALVDFGTKQLLLYSAVELDKEKDRNYSKSMLGHLDIENKDIRVDSILSLDSGHHFYAPQALVDDRGRKILIAWMEMWGHKNVTHELGHHWSGALTFPRELKLEGDQLFQTPIEEIKNYRSHSEKLSDMMLSKTSDVEVSSTKEEFVLRFQNPLNPMEYFEIGYLDHQFYVDGLHIPLDPLPRKVSQYRFEEVSLRILIDKSSFEIFVNEGVECFTSRVFMNCDHYFLSVDKGLHGYVHTLAFGGVTK